MLKFSSFCLHLKNISAKFKKNNLTMPKLKIVKIRPRRKPEPDFEFFSLEDMKEESLEVEDIKEEYADDENDSCKLCCETSLLLTNSVYDDVIVSFFNVIPNLVSSRFRGLYQFLQITPFVCFSRLMIRSPLGFASSALERRKFASNLSSISKSRMSS